MHHRVYALLYTVYGIDCIYEKENTNVICSHTETVLRTVARKPTYGPYHGLPVPPHPYWLHFSKEHLGISAG